jgi:glucose-specific phosphotransferase system IIA component
MGFLDRFKKKDTVLLAPQTGEAVPLEQVPDEVFSQKMLGDGIAILPTEDLVKSPVSGTVIQVFDTLHAYGIKSGDGLEILVHIGINTVGLNGDGFEALVKEGDTVAAGTPLARVNLELLKQKGIPAYTPVLITNMDEISAVSCYPGKTIAGETTVIRYTKK